MTDDVIAAWRRAGPLSAESTRLLDALEEARRTGEGENGAWFAFLLSLTEEQQRAMLDLINLSH